jgi:CRISPR/Cas system CSM-associated protein Csm3 (group 7 of RAMP superfamily)
MRYRDTVAGDLVARTPVHVGALLSASGVDLPTARDGQGCVTLPGTALAGALRSTLGETGNRFDIWGGGEKTGGGRRSGSYDASRITVFDAPAPGQGYALSRTELRQNVSIDRYTGAAATGHLFTREVVPVGTRFSFRFVLESVNRSEREAAAIWIRRCLTRLVTVGVVVGAGETSGLGRVLLSTENLLWTRDDFTTPVGLAAALNVQLSTAEASEASTASWLDNLAKKGRQARENGSPLGTDVLRVTIPWRPLGPVMSKDAADGLMAAWFPLAVPSLTEDGEESKWLHLLLPGSSVKGSLRTRAEYIARVASGWRDLGAEAIEGRFGEQIKATALLPGVTELFGSPGDYPNDAPGNKGALTIHDVCSAEIIPAGQWRKVRSFKRDSLQGTAAFMGALNALNGATRERGLWFDYATRNKIDRWSGAVVDTALFSGVEPYVKPGARVWKDITIDLDLKRLRQSCGQDHERMLAALGLLLLVLRDMSEGWVPLGFGTTRGMGSIKVCEDDVTFRGELSEGTQQADWAEQAANSWPEAISHIAQGQSLANLLESNDVLDIDDAWQKRVTEAQPEKRNDDE